MNQQEKDKIVRKLIDTNTTISTMESCTSGLIASMITDTEGASAVFPGGYGRNLIAVLFYFWTL